MVPGADGIKTGFTNQAGYGFLGSAERNGRRLVMVVAASPRGRDRNQAARDLIEWGFSAFDQQRLFAPAAEVAKAEVQGGDSTQVALVAPAGVYVDIPAGAHRDVKLTVNYEGPVRAPIRQGEQIAKLTVSIDGMSDFSVPLVARDAVEEAGLGRRILNGVLGWVT